MMTNANHDPFLDTIVMEAGWNFRVMLSDIQEFLTFSEHNIERHLLVERQSIRRQERNNFGLNDDLAPPYQDHLLANAEHRFTVALPLHVRYAALGSITNTIEWAAHFF